MYYMISKRKYRKTGRNFVQKLRLKTHPLAIKMLRPGERPPVFAPGLDMLFDEKDMASALIFTHFRRMDGSVTIRKENFSDRAAAVTLGFERINDNDLFFKEMETSAGFKRDADAEKKAFKAAASFAPSTYDGMVISPLPQTFVSPDVVLIP